MTQCFLLLSTVWRLQCRAEEEAQLTSWHKVTSLACRSLYVFCFSKGCSMLQLIFLLVLFREATRGFLSVYHACQWYSMLPTCCPIHSVLSVRQCLLISLLSFFAFLLAKLSMPNSPFQVPCASCGCFLELLALVGTGTRMRRLNRLI